LKDWAVMFVPWTLIVGPSPGSVALALLGLAATILAVVALLGLERAWRGRFSEPTRWFAQAVIAFAVSLGAVVVSGIVIT